ncbi:MAG: hypothetical protein IJT02_05705 [Synergistaceae bacterium]|nr:hypothetical protein [Synergistaceae bacterium]
MPNDVKNIPDMIQAILDKNKGFIAMSKLASQMSANLRDKLGIKSKTPVKILMKKLEGILEDRFVLRRKGSTQFLMTPCDPAELVLAELSPSKPVSPKALAAVLKPFARSDIRSILNELEETGKIKTLYNEKLEPQIFSAEIDRHIYEPSEELPEQSVEYTRGKFREAFDELDRGRVFVRICDLRRKLNWPRDVFDQMLKTLRDKEIIQMHIGDEHLMTPDEVQDSFVNELNYLMGTVTWNVR